ncbi:MAG: hypothetical protein WCK53_15120 [Methanomicrobiales archaeon]
MKVRTGRKVQTGKYTRWKLTGPQPARFQDIIVDLDYLHANPGVNLTE